jgi:hypothetical protein
MKCSQRIKRYMTGEVGEEGARMKHVAKAKEGATDVPAPFPSGC